MPASARPAWTPWLPVNPNYADGVNVRDQQDDPGSLLNFYRRLIEVRRQLPALVTGEYRPLHETADDYVAFLRTTEAQTVLVLLNYSNARHELRFDVPGKQTARVRFSSARNDGDLEPGQPQSGRVRGADRRTDVSAARKHPLFAVGASPHEIPSPRNPNRESTAGGDSSRAIQDVLHRP